MQDNGIAQSGMNRFPFTLNCRGRLLTLSGPAVMGIINATPDSFYSGSRRMMVDGAVALAEKMLQDGAAILDIGGQSTRPGAEQVGAAEELERLLPVIDAIIGRFPDAVLSVDTYHSIVAEQAVAHGVSMINDISGGQFDDGMLPLAASLRTPFICMHVQGSDPAQMHTVPAYNDVVQDVLDYFVRKTEECQAAGINDIIIDPGFGFSKTVAHNFSLLKHLEAFSILPYPLLLGISRKSTIYRTLGIGPEDSLNGTTVLNTAGLLKGAAILRVHDVKEAVQAVALCHHLV